MKSFFFLLFITSNLITMQKPNCFYAHQKFLAMISSCEQRTGWYGLEPIELRQQCIAILFDKFKQECQEETASRVITK